MTTEVKEFRGVKFGEPSTEVRPLHTDPQGILWCDKKEEQKIGLVRVSRISYGFYKGKFMNARVKFGGTEAYEVFLRALTEKYGTQTDIKPGDVWKVGDVIISLVYDSSLQVDEGSLTYQFIPSYNELKVDLEKKRTEELKMKVNAAKTDL
jgi:hypothetical protein